MPGPKIDGAGTAKLATLDRAMNYVYRLNTVVELCAQAVKGSLPASPFAPQLRRAAYPLVGLLKGQFGMISDQVSAFLLIATRGGGNDQTRVRGLREAVAQIRVQIELAVAKTHELHTVEEVRKE
jgi:hypothetical protein